MAMSGIAGTLLPGGSTIHAKLKVPIKLTNTSECKYKENSDTEEMVKQAKLLVIDEVTQGNKQLYETVPLENQEKMTGLLLESPLSFLVTGCNVSQLFHVVERQISSIVL